MKIVIYPNQQVTAEALADIVAMQLQVAIDSRGKASIAVPGGTTPTIFLHALSYADLDWSKINLTTTDERQVPIEHPRSNARLVKDTLITREASAVNFFAQNKSTSSQELNEQFEQNFSPLDVCVLGMGDDGHTASLFPGVDQQWLNPEGTSMIAFTKPPGDLEPRITLTAGALLKAQNIHMLIHGEAKHDVLQQALSGDDISSMPVRSILHHANERVVVRYARN